MFILNTDLNYNVYLLSMQCVRCLIKNNNKSMLEFILDSSLFEQWPQGSLVSRRMNVVYIAWLPYGLRFHCVSYSNKNQMKKHSCYQTLRPFLFLCTPYYNDPKAGDRTVSAPWTDSLQLLILKKTNVNSEMVTYTCLRKYLWILCYLNSMLPITPHYKQLPGGNNFFLFSSDEVFYSELGINNRYIRVLYVTKLSQHLSWIIRKYDNYTKKLHN